MARIRPMEWNGVPIPYGATVEKLRERLKEAGPPAWAAFAALGHTPGVNSLRLQVEASCSVDWRCRRCAVEAISDHILTTESADMILHALQDQNNYVVITACRAVTLHRISQAHTLLSKLLAHAEPSVREAAVTALASVWQLQDCDRVKRLHLIDDSPEVSRDAAYALMRNVTKAAWRDLFNLCQSSPLERYHLWAVQLAQQYGGQETDRLLAGFQNDKDGHVRKAAIS